MKKTSIYLTPEDEARLERLVQRERKSRAEIIRAALAQFEARPQQPRQFHLDGCFEGDGRSIADFSAEEMAELMKGFGEH